MLTESRCHGQMPGAFDKVRCAHYRRVDLLNWNLVGESRIVKQPKRNEKSNRTNTCELENAHGAPLMFGFSRTSIYPLSAVAPILGSGPEASCTSFATETGFSDHVRFTPGSDRTTDITNGWAQHRTSTTSFDNLVGS